jgi:hypothetical protein
MKEAEATHKDEVAEVRQVQVKKKKAFIGKMVKGDGHNLYEYNRVTMELQVVKPENAKTTNFTKKKLGPNEVYIPHDAVHKKFQAKENCTYLYALNEKNAIKKVIKLFNPPHIKLVDE